MPKVGNIFANLPVMGSAEEDIAALLDVPGLRVERIVSTGQASPPGFWYDQPREEWVMLLSGAARLRFDGEGEARALKPGDFVFIPAHRRHRVDWTSPDAPTVWLALHFDGGGESNRAQAQTKASPGP
ncbi:cupin domain-containing protein [Rhodomicrobium sp. Az07]|uniref:cupin domain-containing protein n=1 Tax=Rhodomicrobium sp. Az07 TaxID=2839034 RepID=UPI001BE793CF|nr:cupin domain-containing protein [Rhodomicrobium sp. Az07]MBT3071550.1 cupin domain-containing protein [Rhodomicrobium sp. Az07]